MKRAKLWLGIGGGVLLLIVAFVSARQPERPAPPPPKPSFEVDIPTTQEIRAMLGTYGQRVEETEKTLSTLVSDLLKMRESTQQALAEVKDHAAITAHPLPVTLQRDPSTLARFRTFDFNDAKPTPRSIHIPAGSYGEAWLITGAFAPTSGEALPVLLRLDAALAGPQRSRIPIRGALLVGKAQGDANSARATIQLDTLSVVGPDGRAIETKVNGWAIDEDGVQGVRGTYVWRASELASLAATAGGLSAAAEALSAQETVTQSTPLGGTQSSVTGDPLRFAGYRAAGGAAEKVAEIVARRLDEIGPAVHVPGGRRVRVAFVGGATLEGLAVEDSEQGH